MKKLLTLIAVTLPVCAQSAHAQGDNVKAAAGRQSPPSGIEIAAAARVVTLDHAVAAGATMFSRPFRFTPAKLKGALEDGGVIGVLENGAEGDETGLPPGKYHLYTARVAGQWRTYAETGGQIVREAIRTSVTQADRAARPTFRTRGWCITVTSTSNSTKSRDAIGYVTHACF